VTAPRNVSSTVSEQAKTIFFERYVHGNSRTYDYISSLISKTKERTCLSDAIDAASLAYFSTQNPSVEILRQAREKYVLALQLVSASIESRDLALKDTTLVSVLLLDLFEKLTRTYRSSESWTKHMNGAIELVKLRGNAQFQNALGLRMFLQLNSTILIGCMQYDVRVPADLTNLRREASRYVDSTDPKWKFSEIVVRVVDFRAAMRECRISGLELLNVAKRLDSELKAVPENVPPEWTYQTIMLHSPFNGVYGDSFHVYADHHMTHTWNNIRIIRILLNKLIQRHYLAQTDSGGLPMSISEDFNHELAQVSESIVALSAGIVASVPQYTQLPRHTNALSPISPSRDAYGQFLSESTQNTSSSTTKATSSDPNPVTFCPRDFTPFETSRCYSLIFPLYVAGNAETCPESLREWIIDSLDFIEKVVGIKEAALAAGYLKRREKINPWSLYAMIGSYSFSA
jgi:hypothetical protein